LKCHTKDLLFLYLFFLLQIQLGVVLLVINSSFAVGVENCIANNLAASMVINGEKKNKKTAHPFKKKI